jgi:RHS repeat-associated protein
VLALIRLVLDFVPNKHRAQHRLCNYKTILHYDADHNRIREVNANGTTLFVNPGNALLFEKHSNLGTDNFKHYIPTPVGVVAVFTQTKSATVNTTDLKYLHKDHLGSTVVVTSGNAANLGAVVERLSYDPWGKRRNANGSDATTVPASFTDRGFTGHEHVKTAGNGIIHMNGRVYDANLGRFISPDPQISMPEVTQDYNRYSYCLNNPLSLTDPTGYSWLSKAWRKIKKYIKPIVAIAVAWFAPQVSYALLGPGAFGGLGASGILSGTAATALGSAVGGAAASAIMGGDPRQGALSGLLFFGAGQVPGANSFGRYAAHAIAGCASADAGGGDCGSGAASAVFGKFSTNSTQGNFVATIVAGGVGAELGGGKFSNGAHTAAFGYLFNECGATGACGRQGGYDPNEQWPYIDENQCIRGGGLPTICVGPGLIRAVGSRIWSATRTLTPAENAYAHWTNHASEFPELSNAKQYVDAARAFVTTPPPGTLTMMRGTDRLLYNPATNTFAVEMASGVPRTMFRPSDGINYWYRQ